MIGAVVERRNPKNWRARHSVEKFFNGVHFFQICMRNATYTITTITMTAMTYANSHRIASHKLAQMMACDRLIREQTEVLSVRIWPIESALDDRRDRMGAS